MRPIASSLSAIVLVLVLSFHAHAQAGDPPPLDAYGDLPAIEDASISPEGGKVALAGTMQGDRMVVMLDDQFQLLRAGLLGETKLRNLRWIGNDGLLLTTSDTEYLGGGFTSDHYEAVRASIMWLAPGREDDLVFVRNRRIVDSVFGTYGLRELEGRWTGFFGGIQLEQGPTDYRLATTKPTLFAVDLEKNSADRVAFAAPRDRWRDWLIDGNGRVAATFDMDKATGSWTLEGPRKRTIASGRHRTGSAGLVALGKDGDTVIFFERDDDDRPVWYQVPLDGSAGAETYLPDTVIKEIFVDSRNSRLIGYRRGGSETGLVFFDPAKQDIATRLDGIFQGVHMDIAGWSTDFGKFVVRTSGNGDAGTWYVIDMAGGAATPLSVERPAIAPHQVGLISTIEYKAQDGLELDGILTMPPGSPFDAAPEKPHPVIILPHGGPNSHDEAVFDWWAQAFASRGYAVFQPNFRGSTNRSTAFRAAGKGEWGGKMLTDMSDGLAALAKAGYADPERACIMGASYGGYAALAGVTVQQGLYRCSVAVAPVSDLELMYKTNYRESGQSSLVKRAMLDTLGDRSDIHAISPRQQAGKADAPILLIHGKDDTVVLFEQSEKMADALKDAGKPYKMVELAEEDHWLSRAESRKQMLREAMQFVQEHNPPD